jgi:hypothetical protein
MAKHTLCRMKTLVLGDIHGRPCWKQIVELEEFDRVVFVGDYVDTHEQYTGAEQLNNLMDILEYSKRNDVILLIGNHDHHYWPGIAGGTTSGYQPRMRASFEKVFHDNRNHFQMAYADNHGNLITHAGVTKDWLEYVDIGETDPKLVADAINDLFVAKPGAFTYYPLDWSGYGNHTRQSPTWVRPEKLYRDKFDTTQIVGHTRYDGHINPKVAERAGFWLIDGLGNKWSDYLMIEDGEVKVHTIIHAVEPTLDQE